MANKNFTNSILIEILVNIIFTILLIPLWKKIYSYFKHKRGSKGFLSRTEGVAPTQQEKQNLDDLCED